MDAVVSRMLREMGFVLFQPSGQPKLRANPVFEGPLDFAGLVEIIIGTAVEHPGIVEVVRIGQPRVRERIAKGSGFFVPGIVVKRRQGNETHFQISAEI